MTTAGRFTIDSIKRRSASLPDRIVLYGDPGVGKTSFAARMPSPIFLLTPGDDRLKKLIEMGLCPETDHFPDCAQCWDDVKQGIDVLMMEKHDFKTLVIDTGNAIEWFAHEEICANEFDNDWGERGFSGFGRGEKIAADKLWVPLLERLDELRERRRMRIVLLCHKGIVTVRNPEGGDYDKIVPALSKRAWGYTAKWADMILYNALELQIAKDDPKSKIQKNKAKGGRVRLLHCQPTAAYDAKNVHRLPPTIRLGDNPERAYDLFRAAFPQRRPVNAPKPDEGTAATPAVALPPVDERQPGDEPEEEATP